MLNITKNQFEHLEKSKISNFHHLVQQYLNTHYARNLAILGDDAEQLEWIEAVVNDAQSHGMQRENDLYSYVRAAITFDEDFVEQPWAKNIFDMKIMPSTKAALLDDGLLDELERLSKQNKREQDVLHREKVRSYAKQKASYVYSFNAFYGLQLSDTQAAEDWLTDFARTAIEFGFNTDFMLDSVLEVALYFGDDYHSRPWAQDIINGDNSASTKVVQLLNHLSAKFGGKDARA